MSKKITPSEAGRLLSSLGASKGGKARAKKLTPERRKEIAQNAIRARWSRTTGLFLLRKACTNSIPERPIEEIRIIRRKKFAASFASEADDVPTAPTLSSFGILDLNAMSEEELENLRYEYCREWNIFGAIGGDGWHPEKGWSTSLVWEADDGEHPFIGWRSKIPIHDRHDFLVWLCWELLVRIP
jgi:hypothetical protein